MEYKEEESVSFSHIGREWHIYRADMESLWESMGNNQDAIQAFYEDERLPYWAELWSSGFGLATWLKQNEGSIAGNVCLDLGCGLGFTALCGTVCKAKVLACDYEKQALDLVRFNALKNAVLICEEYEEPCSCVVPLAFGLACSLC
jgi:predicted nicotinamide N-methyase